LRAMHYSSREGENVLDLFGGSGSTLAAAEQAKRNAFLMELDPLDGGERPRNSWVEPIPERRLPLSGTGQKRAKARSAGSEPSRGRAGAAS